jgi:hypothetical protein
MKCPGYPRRPLALEIQVQKELIAIHQDARFHHNGY